MKATINYTGILSTVQCPSCGIMFAMPEEFEQHRREDGRSFYCPVGHSMSFGATAMKALKELERERKNLKSQLAAQRAATDQAEAARDHAEALSQQLRKNLSTTRGQMTRMQNRVKNGVCPCCNRSFVQLGRHMKTKHPEWSGQEGV